TSIHYLFNGTAKNTGVGGLSHVTIVDTLPAGSSNITFKAGSSPGSLSAVVTGACPTGSPSGATCADLGSIAGGATKYWSVEFDSTALNVQNNAYATGSAGGGAPGACTDAATVCSAPTQDSCSTAPTNTITITKACGVPIGFPNATLPGTQLVTQ